mgnify:CR=1 FL=1
MQGLECTVFAMTYILVMILHVFYLATKCASDTWAIEGMCTNSLECILIFSDIMRKYTVFLHIFLNIFIFKYIYIYF